jgi:anti-sigma factor RsiW
MNCEQTRRLADAYLDGELDLVRSLELEDHLRQCALCAAACQNERTLMHSFSAGGLRYSAPAALGERVRTALRSAVRVAPNKSRPSWRVLSMAAAILLAVGFAGGGLYDRLVQKPERQLAAQVVAAHIRSLQAAHLTDVASSDRHTVKPWFSGKLDFAVPTVDLDTAGFELTGGRLDVLDLRQAAALIYHRRQHAINIFIQPAPERADASLRELMQQGYHLLHWTAAGMDYWAISDLNSRELREFVGQFQERLQADKSP